MSRDIVTVDPTVDVVPAGPDADLLDRLATFLRLNVAEGDASESTIRIYMSHIKGFVVWCAEEGVRPAAASDRDLALYRRALAEAGYARSTIGAKLSALRRFYEAAIWHGYRDDNPAAGLKPPREHTSKRDRILKRYLTPEQVQGLLAAPDASTDAGKRDRAMMALMYYHALRVSEVVSLKLEEVTGGATGRIAVREAKGKKDRTVLTIPLTERILDEWIAVREDHVTAETDGALFVSFGVTSAGTPLTTCGARWVVNNYLKALGYYREGLSCHSLRHAHASHVIAAGGNVMPLAREMGHASPETTQIYVEIVDAVAQNPAALLAQTVQSAGDREGGTYGPGDGRDRG